ncbi:Neuronal PAS domain-containing protein 4 [Oryzias melastigma]|uniref:Neuronal PAS domain-containing protein 4 n=1 Tax=Oryzias melastigma TaxID=30732 RepID=A0A834CF63_ORYME|nr:Neuronal PAS domain-containing protein 4 [Oryzias melastigma]
MTAVGFGAIKGGARALFLQTGGGEGRRWICCGSSEVTCSPPSFISLTGIGPVSLDVTRAFSPPGSSMTLWCSSCKCHVRAPCTSQHLQREERRATCRRFRSTKGASKARRDHINHEIRNMRALLPISQEDQERLSYLHSMAAICTYIRKSVLFQGLPSGGGTLSSLPCEAFLEALHGFILVTTAEGRLVYVSENVDEHLGFSMLDVLQGDTIYDMVERSDVDAVQAHLDVGSSSSSERSFVCCMQTSKAFKVQHGSCCSMLVRGSFQLLPRSSSVPGGELLFVALCTPTVNRLSGAASQTCRSFSSTHRLDMSFAQLSHSVFFFLGRTAEEMRGQSWYSLVHPEDLSPAANCHTKLIEADEGFQVEMVVRLQCSDLSWTWVYIRANRDSKNQQISCTNFIVSPTEATFLQKKICCDAFKSSSVPSSFHFTQNAPAGERHQRMKRQSATDERCGELDAGGRWESERDIYCVLCTSSLDSSSSAPLADSPVLYSPASSSSPLELRELHHDLLMDAHECTDQLLSSPEGSASCYSHLDSRLSSHQSPTASEAAFEQRDLPAFGEHSPLSSVSSSVYGFQACTSNARLVPDCLFVSDMCESPPESVSLHPHEFDLLEDPQGGSVVQIPHQELTFPNSLLPPLQPVESDQYDEKEQAEISVLAQQISSLASTFSRHQTPPQNAATPLSACDWPPSCPPPSLLLPRCELLSDDSLVDSILKGLDVVPLKNGCHSAVSRHPPCSLSRSAEPEAMRVPAEQLPSGGAAKDHLGFPHSQNTGLHQLNHCLQSRFHQGNVSQQILHVYKNVLISPQMFVFLSPTRWTCRRNLVLK